MSCSCNVPSFEGEYDCWKKNTTWQCFHPVPVAQDCFPSSLCSHTSASSGCSLGGGLKAGLWKDDFILDVWAVYKLICNMTKTMKTSGRVKFQLRTPTHHVAWIHQAKIQGWLLHVDKLPCNPIPGGRELLPSCPRPWAAGNCYLVHLMLVQLIADTTLIRLPLGLEIGKGGKFTWLSVTRLSLWSIQGGIGWLHLTW